MVYWFQTFEIFRTTLKKHATRNVFNVKLQLIIKMLKTQCSSRNDRKNLAFHLVGRASFTEAADSGSTPGYVKQKP